MLSFSYSNLTDRLVLRSKSPAWILCAGALALSTADAVAAQHGGAQAATPPASSNPTTSPTPSSTGGNPSQSSSGTTQYFDFSSPELRQTWRRLPEKLEPSTRFFCFDVKEDLDPDGYLIAGKPTPSSPTTAPIYGDLPIYATDSSRKLTDEYGTTLQCEIRKAMFKRPLLVGDRIVVVLRMSNRVAKKISRIAINYQAQQVTPIILTPLRASLDADAAIGGENDANNEGGNGGGPTDAHRSPDPDVPPQSDPAKVADLAQTAVPAADPETQSELTELETQMRKVAQAQADAQRAKYKDIRAGVLGYEKTLQSENPRPANFQDQMRIVHREVAVARDLDPDDINLYTFELNSRLPGDVVVTLAVSAEFEQKNVTVLDTNGQPECLGTAPPASADQQQQPPQPPKTQTVTPAIQACATLTGPAPDQQNAVLASRTSKASQTLLTETLPQSHALSYFNIEAGIVYNSTRTHTYAWNTTPTTPGGSIFKPISNGSSPIIDPVLMFMVYPHPIDAESPTDCASHLDLAKCLHETAITLGLSMANPTEDFYGGLALEPVRGVQLVGGASFTKTMQPASTGSGSEYTCTATSSTCQNPPTQASTPPTLVGHWRVGGYVGFTFDVKSFIQAITGWGGGASSAAGGGSPG